MKVLKIIWMLTIITSFFGATLALPAYQSIFAYRVLLLIHFIGFVFYFILKRKEIKFKFNIKDYFWFYLVWFVWAIVSLIWADSKGDALRHIWFLFSGISLIVFSVVHFQTEKDLHNLFRIFMLVLTVFLGVSMWEHLYRYNIGVGGSAVFFERGIPNGFMVNPNDLATFLTLYMPFFFGLLTYGKNKINGVVGLTGILLAFHVILLTRSRANLFALAIMLLVCIWLAQPWKMLKKIRVRTLLILCGIFLLGFYLINYHQGTWYFLAKEKQRIIAQFTSLEDSSSLTIRFTLLAQGAKLLINHYLLGVGAGNVEYHMMPFREMTQGIVNMHNWWGEVLVNYGLIVGVFYLCFFAKMLWELLGVYQKSGNCQILKMFTRVLLISFSGFIIAVTSSSTMAASRYMWVLFAAALSVINIYRGKTGA